MATVTICAIAAVFAETVVTLVVSFLFSPHYYLLVRSSCTVVYLFKSHDGSPLHCTRY